MNGTLHPGKKKNIGDMMVLETIPSSQERIKAVIISSSAGMKHLISQIIITKKKINCFLYQWSLRRANNKVLLMGEKN